ncbi:hypothetical protein NKG05_12965 [Oerskovia sp. M15]
MEPAGHHAVVGRDRREVDAEQRRGTLGDLGKASVQCWPDGLEELFTAAAYALTDLEQECRQRGPPREVGTPDSAVKSVDLPGPRSSSS